MQFPPGKPILLLIAIAVASGAGLLLFPPPQRGANDLVLWTFDDAQGQAYESAAPTFQEISGQHLSVELISNQGLNTMLSSMFLSGSAAGVSPDAAEIEIGSIGRYFRPPTDAVGFLPLNDFLEHGGYRRIRSLADPGQTGWNAVLAPDPSIYVREHGRWVAEFPPPLVLRGRAGVGALPYATAGTPTLTLPRSTRGGDKTPSNATAPADPAPADWPDWIPGVGDRVIRSLGDGGEDGWRARLEPEATVYHFDGRAWLPDPVRTRPDAWIDRILPSRLAPWTKDGEIFGLPRDVHPVTITYRADLFAQAGVDLADATTWPAFQEACLRFQEYWSAHGYPHRHAIELSHASSDDLEMMLLQRHVNLIDADDEPRLTDPLVLRTLLFYTQLIAGPRQIGANPAGGTGLWAADLAEGNVCAMITPDWKAQELRLYAPSLAGQLRMMPLPRFDPGDAPTSTWGGTMIGIPRAIPPAQVEPAWRLIEFLYLDPPNETGIPPQADAGIVPPLPERWSEPRWHQADPYFGGQNVGELYVQLAGQIPPRYVSATSSIAEFELAFVVGRAAKQMERAGSIGLDAYCRQRLADTDADLRRRAAQGRFE